MSDSRSQSNNPNSSPRAKASKSDGSIVKAVIAAAVGIFCTIYLFNPTWGVIEFIPDNLPFVGNLDEATATALLLSSLAYFGWDLRTIFGRRGQSIDDDRRTIDHQGPVHDE